MTFVKKNFMPLESRPQMKMYFVTEIFAEISIELSLVEPIYEESYEQ